MRKIGRNEKCHCGSNKKYKKCHFALDKTIKAESEMGIGLVQVDRLGKMKKNQLKNQYGHIKFKFKYVKLHELVQMRNRNRYENDCIVQGNVEMTEILAIITEWMWHSENEFTKENLHKWIREMIFDWDVLNVKSQVGKESVYWFFNCEHNEIIDTWVNMFIKNKKRYLEEIEFHNSGKAVITHDANTWCLHGLEREVLKRVVAKSERIHISYTSEFLKLFNSSVNKVKEMATA